MRLLTLTDWPETAKKGGYSSWESQGKRLAEEKIAEFWDENAPRAYQNAPSGEQRERWLRRALDAWIWRLKQEEGVAPDPDDVFKRIRTNGLFPYVREKLKKVDLFFDLTLASAIGDSEKKGVDEFIRRYGDEIESFSAEWGGKYDKNSDSSQVEDSEPFRWRNFFLNRKALERYRGRAPLCCYLRLTLYRFLSGGRYEEKKQQKKQREIRNALASVEKSAFESTEDDKSNPLDALAQQEEKEKEKLYYAGAVVALNRENRELCKLIFLRNYRELEFAEIGYELGYGDRYDMARKTASRRYDKAMKRLEELIEIERSADK